MAETATAKTPDWETSKENFQPLKRGRRAAGLSRGLRALNPTGASALDEKRQAFEREVAVAHESDDPLSVWKRYIAWITESYPSGGKASGLLEVLHRCTQALLDDERYTNDPDCIVVWIQYANMLPDPADVFRFMRERRIGERVALFWIAFALVAEQSRKYALADKCYKAGIAKRASPADKLKRRQVHFLRRMRSKAAKVMGVEPQASGAGMGVRVGVDLEALAAAEREAERDAVRAKGETVAHRDTRRSAGRAGEDAENPSLAGGRRALGGIDAASAALSQRTPASVAPQGFGNAAAASAAAAAASGNAAIPIFEDDDLAERSAAVAGSAAAAVAALEPAGLPGSARAPARLGSDGELRKENALEARPWTGRGGIAAPAGTEARLAAATKHASEAAMEIRRNRGRRRATLAAMTPSMLGEMFGAADENQDEGDDYDDDYGEDEDEDECEDEDEGARGGEEADNRGGADGLRGPSQRRGRAGSDLGEAGSPGRRPGMSARRQAAADVGRQLYRSPAASGPGFAVFEDGDDDEEDGREAERGRADTVAAGDLSAILGDAGAESGYRRGRESMDASTAVGLASGAATADLSALIGALGRPDGETGHGLPGSAAGSRGGRAGAAARHTGAAGHSTAHDTTHGSSTGAFTGDDDSDDDDDDGSDRHSAAGGATDEDLARMAAQASVLADSMDEQEAKAAAAGRAGRARSGPGARPAATTPSRGGGILDALSPASGAHHSRARRGAPDRAAAAERAAADDVTINTRLAVADLDAMLASPSAGLATQPARGQGVFQPGAPKMRPATSPQPQAMSFAVFVEEDDDSPPRAADPSRRAPAAAAGAGSAASFAVYDENEAAAAGPGDGHAGRPVFADENAPSENAPGAMRPAAQRSIRDPRVAAGALRSLPVPEAPPSRRPSHRDALRAAQTGGSVDAGGSFVIFQDGLSDAAAQRAAESARDAFDE
ncbi:hypothetical protein FNF29_01224 [Cafeteria roenbergensis]|uniref:BUB1 N-terminal domain-containing protein n=1 Tax=Cafeteria roenbergensis TaxID=33653 RepID=A0A5A8CTF7_CAFRO|nr:hypothetical protein FNF29_01224 [Cafeteria roenbergensis]|eukprot:KAA0156432.1 hypothetical protein FNF29_01224 [Cafeteria roenbergensis]